MVAHVAVEGGVGVAPLAGGLAEESDIEQVGFIGVGDGGLGGGDFGRDEVCLHCIGVDAVIELGEGAVEVPGQGKAAVFVVFEPLEFLDEVELELNGHPGGELEGDVLVGVSAAVTARFGNQPDGIGRIYPLPGRQDKAVKPGPISKPLEFEGSKSDIVQPLPDAQKLNRVAVSHPILNDVIRSVRFFVPSDIRQGNIVINRLRENCDGGSLNFDDGFPGLTHGFRWWLRRPIVANLPELKPWNSRLVYAIAAHAEKSRNVTEAVRGLHGDFVEAVGGWVLGLHRAGSGARGRFEISAFEFSEEDGVTEVGGQRSEDKGQRSDDIDAHGHGSWAIEHGGSREHAVFGEGVRRIFPMPAPSPL